MGVRNYIRIKDKTLKWLQKPIRKTLKRFELNGLQTVFSSKTVKASYVAKILHGNWQGFDIELVTHYLPNFDKRRKPKRRTRVQILKNLAHEMAHMRYWHHDIKHARLTQEVQDFLLGSYKRGICCGKRKQNA